LKINNEIKIKRMDQTPKKSNLIYDVGMHKGEDTDYYLKKGFKVIAFEADPFLATQCRARFDKEIQNEQLIIVEGAIIDVPLGKEMKSTVKFFKNKDNSVWGTVAEDWALRNEHLGTSNEIIEVATIDFAECLRKYGIPYYLKIDIEGMDTICLKSLSNFELKPDYISIESDKVSFGNLEEEFRLFTNLGYSNFQTVNQSTISKQKEPKQSQAGSFLNYHFLEGSSGLFGKDLPDNWKSNEQIQKEYTKIFRGYKLFGDYSKLRKFYLGRIFIKVIAKLSAKPIPGWYDTHAKHSSVIE